MNFNFLTLKSLKAVLYDLVAELMKLSTAIIAYLVLGTFYKNKVKQI